MNEFRDTRSWGRRRERSRGRCKKKKAKQQFSSFSLTFLRRRFKLSSSSRLASDTPPPLRWPLSHWTPGRFSREKEARPPSPITMARVTHGVRTTETRLASESPLPAKCSSLDARASEEPWLLGTVSPFSSSLSLPIQQLGSRPTPQEPQEDRVVRALLRGRRRPLWKLRGGRAFDAAAAAFKA